MQDCPLKDDFPTGFHEELGGLLVAWGRVEYLFKLCGKDLCGEGFTAGMRIQIVKEKKFNDFCKHYEPLAQAKLSEEQASVFSELLAEARELLTLRNDNIHALWTTDDRGEPVRLRPKKNKHRDDVDWFKNVVPVCQIRDTRKRIENLFLRIDKERRTWSIPRAH
ncbi:hypothetical protein HDG34_007886 [Paraburkholderia sp. HC6.4b]|uniref:hypothetical protein n=1 Tax=unclassified Paraburkholderia TaxID=2615204 RepID=UPI00161AA6C0|nr:MULTISPECIES: hypothetical protein [unclassified Paraburkholderia]MBB5413903.1 hypothetical protein [Paraburkholderia sp. HC6.4b]MBB5453241.1 hypothetical protein [Paraburkholderia sp. Kb1A]